MKTKALKYLFVGLLVDIVMVLVAGLVLSVTYEGYCSSLGFGGPRQPCSRIAYIIQIMLVISIAGWWLLLPALALPPAVGFHIGRGRPADPPPR